MKETKNTDNNLINKEANKIDSNNSEEHKPLVWYYFYNFILLPLLLLMNVNSISSIENYLNASNLKTYTLPYILFMAEIIIFSILIIIKVILFFKMFSKKQNTLKLIKTSIYIPTIIYILTFIVDTFIEIDNQNWGGMIAYIIFIAITLMWTLLNISYFEDRKDIFKN